MQGQPTYTLSRKGQVPDPSYNVIPERTVFVRSGGDDNADGRSPETAVKTLEKAIELVGVYFEAGDSQTLNRIVVTDAVDFGGEQGLQLPNYTWLFAPYSRLRNLTLGGGCIVDVHLVLNDSTGNGITISGSAPTSSTNVIRANRIEASSSGPAIYHTQVNHLIVETPMAIKSGGSGSLFGGSTATDDGNLTLDIGVLMGAVITTAHDLITFEGSAGDLSVRVGRVVQVNSGATTFINNDSSATVNAMVGFIDVTTIDDNAAGATTNILKVGEGSVRSNTAGAGAGTSNITSVMP